MEMNEEKKEINIKIRLDDDIAQGKYSNFIMLNNTDSEFVLDFIFLQPQQPQAKVVSRIISAPRHIKRLQLLLNTSIEKFEQKFGKIELQNQDLGSNNFNIVH